MVRVHNMMCTCHAAGTLHWLCHGHCHDMVPGICLHLACACVQSIGQQDPSKRMSSPTTVLYFNLA